MTSTISYHKTSYIWSIVRVSFEQPGWESYLPQRSGCSAKLSTHRIDRKRRTVSSGGKTWLKVRKISVCIWLIFALPGRIKVQSKTNDRLGVNYSLSHKRKKKILSFSKLFHEEWGATTMTTNIYRWDTYCVPWHIYFWYSLIHDFFKSW